MAKSQQTFSKSEKEKKRLKKRLDKQKKMDARKADKDEHGPSGIQFAYVDHNGNLTDTPPDPELKVEYELEDIQISVSKKEDLPEEDPVRKGKVSFFDSSKGFGFIIDMENNEKYFNGLFFQCHLVLEGFTMKILLLMENICRKILLLVMNTIQD